MNIFQYPQVRVVIVVLITTVIAIGIGMLMSRVLTPPPKQCKGNTHLDENTNKCLPNCQDGYKNDPITGECVIDCPDGEVSSKSISGVTIPGKERCVTPCGSGACDPETSLTLCQDGVCYEPNCKTTDDKASYCDPPKLCGTDSNGKKKTNLPSGTILDAYGCYKKTTPDPPAPICSDPTPNLVTGTGAYAKEHVCCKTTEFGIYTKQGEPFCCPDEDDIIIDRKCCPKAQQCTFGDKTVCLTTDQVCTPEGSCKTENAIGQPGDYTGCCPFPTSNGECHNMCTYVGTSDTGMKDTCSTDADCNFKSGFSFDGIPTAGGKCDNGKCKLYCGPADSSLQGNIVCLNDDNSGKSTCIDTNKMCKYNIASYDPPPNGNIYICNDDKTSYWKSASGSPTLTTTLTQASGSGPCSALSCLERTISTGMLSDNVSIATSGKQKTIPKTNISTTTTKAGQTCEATYECNKMSISKPGGGSVQWQNQTPPSTAMILNQVQTGIFNGSWSGGSCISNPSQCKFLTSGIYAPNGTLDGVTPSDRALTGSGCQPASATNSKSTYPSSVYCKTIKSNNPSGGYNISPNYYCGTWGMCCGTAGVVKQGDPNTCIGTQVSVVSNGKYYYKPTPKGNYASFNNIYDAIRGRSVIPNTQILDASGSMNPPAASGIIQNTNINIKNISMGMSLTLMLMKGKPVSFGADNILAVGDGSEPINFYYYYSNFNNIHSTGKAGTYQIPLLKGYFATGSGPDACRADTGVASGTVWSWPGIPIRAKSSKNPNYAVRDMNWGAKDYSDGFNLTIVYNPENGFYYLGAIKCYYYVSWGNQSNNEDVVYYGKVDSDNKINFTETNPANADPIDQLIVLGMGKATGKTAPWYNDSPDNGFINADMQHLLLCGMVSQSQIYAEYCNNLDASNKWILDKNNLTYNSLKSRVYNNYR